MVFILYTVFVAGAVAALFGDGGMARPAAPAAASCRTARIELADQQRKVETLRLEIFRLERDPAARERIAREELGLVRPGENLFLLPEEGGYGSGPRDPDGPGEAEERPGP